MSTKSFGLSRLTVLILATSGSSELSIETTENSGKYGFWITRGEYKHPLVTTDCTFASVSAAEDYARELIEWAKKHAPETILPTSREHEKNPYPEQPSMSPGDAADLSGVQVVQVSWQDAVSGLDRIFGELQTDFHDQWDWMDAHFFVEILKAEIEDRSPPSLSPEMEQLTGWLRGYIRNNSAAPSWGTNNGIPWVGIKVADLAQFLDHIEGKGNRDGS